MTTPVIGHTLCGDFKFVAKYDNILVDGDPLAFNEVTRVFSANSNDDSLLGISEKSYSVEVEFLTYPLSIYPTVSTATAASKIEFIHPCL